MDDFFTGLLVGTLVGFFVTVIAFCLTSSASKVITLDPIEDSYKKEVLYYVDTKTKKEYEMENNILYYREEK